MTETSYFDRQLESLFDETFSRCESWIGDDGRGNTVLIDPHERRAIGHHYALSHFAAAAILGCPVGSSRFNLGVSVLKAVLSRWGRDSAVPGFHNDFNNFALVLIHDELERLGICEIERDVIERTVLLTPDSNHDTVNWIPMRMIADEARLRWGGGSSKTVDALRRKIERAANSDGLIEDRLPRGTSFNLQYDVSTVALLDLVEALGIGQPLELEKAFISLRACVLPDGDINYLGRGCNQVFAWGPWLYLLKRRGDMASQKLAIDFVAPRVVEMLGNENILLNGLPGRERQLWWDYHYCSVYSAHLLLWLSLARRASPGGAAGHDARAAGDFDDSGVYITRSEDAMAVVFSGRREYLAECGPEIEALWTRRRGAIHKGSFGPWLGAFGNRWTAPIAGFNHFGLLGVRGERGGMRPLFVPVATSLSDGYLSFHFNCRRRVMTAFNAPLLVEAAAEDISIAADGDDVPLRCVGALVSQYGNETLYQTAPIKARTWQVKIRL